MQKLSAGSLTASGASSSEGGGTIASDARNVDKRDPLIILSWHARYASCASAAGSKFPSLSSHVLEFMCVKESICTRAVGSSGVDAAICPQAVRLNTASTIIERMETSSLPG